MRTSKQICAYRDGYVKFVKPLGTNVSSFSAPKNTRAESDTEEVVKLAYDRMTHRQQDLDFASAVTRRWTLRSGARIIRMFPRGCRRSLALRFMTYMRSIRTSTTCACSFTCRRTGIYEYA